MTLPQPFRQASIAVTAAIAVTMVVAMYAVVSIGGSWDASESSILFAENILSIGINLLGLCIGYCGMRLSWRSVIMLALVALSYDAVNFALVSVAGSHLTGWDIATDSPHNLLTTALTMLFFPVSSMPYRLIHGYLFLLILSPLINRGLAALDRPQMKALVIILTVSVILCGWMAENYLAWWHWNLYYLIYLYVTGYYLSSTHVLDRLPSRRLFIGSGACIIALGAAIYIHDLMSGPWTYWFSSGHANNAFSLTASVLLFAYATRHRRDYNGPPWLATAILGTFMLITGPAATRLMDITELSLKANLATVVVICLSTTAFAAIIAWLIYEPLLLITDFIARRLPALRATAPSVTLTTMPTVARSSCRNSSIELARILAMSMILVEHLTFSKTATDFALYDAWGIIIFGINSCCVSVYVMLLGVMGLRLTWKSVINIWLTVLLFNTLSLVTIALLGKTAAEYHTVTDLVKSLVFPIGSSHYWFIKAYLLLITLIPLVNKGLCRFDLRSLRLLVLMLTCAGIYCGWLGQNPLHDMYNYWGFDYYDYIYPADVMFYFIWLYVIGWWMAREPRLCSLSPWTLIGGFLLFATMQGLLHLSSVDEPDMQTSLFSPYQRQGLLINLSAFLFVCFFTRFSFHNKLINLLGAASLGCYLLQDSKPGFLMYTLGARLFDTHGFSAPYWGFITVYFITIWLLSAIIFHYKRRWMPRLVDKIISRLPQKWKKEIW